LIGSDIRSEQDTESVDETRTVVPTFDDGVAFGIQRCWGTMRAFFDLLVDQLDVMSPFGNNLSEYFPFSISSG
jgi:hypothetical protein